MLVGQHRNFIETGRTHHPHDIRYVCLPRPSTCGMYALGLTGNERYNTIAYDYELYAGPDFFYWLLEQKLEALSRRARHCLALYFAGEEWKHVGIVQNGRVRSKWGTFPVYDHPIAEVPANYGNNVRFYRMPAGDAGLAWFLEYARARGVPAHLTDV
jgi:hypothetical protein